MSAEQRRASVKQIEVTVYGYDPDGAVARIDLDLDGNGTYEVQEPYVTARTRSSSARVVYATAGERTLRSRLSTTPARRRRVARPSTCTPQNLLPVVVADRRARPSRGSDRRSRSGFGRDPDGGVAATTSTSTATARTRPTPARKAPSRRRSRAAGTGWSASASPTTPARRPSSRRTIEVKEGNVPPSVDALARARASRMFTRAASDPDGADLRLRVGPQWRRCLRGRLGTVRERGDAAAGHVGRVELAVRVTDGDGATATDRMVLSLADFPPEPAYVYPFPSQPRVGELVSLSAGLRASTPPTSPRSSGTRTGRYVGPTSGGVPSVTFSTPGVHVVRVRTDRHPRPLGDRPLDFNVSPASGNLAPWRRSAAVVGRVGQPVTLFGGGFDADGDRLDAWDLDEDGEFDDGQFLLGDVHTVGEHTVAVRVTDNLGADPTQYRTVAVHSDNRPPRPIVGHNRGAGVGSLRLVQNDEVVVAGAERRRSPGQVRAWDLDDDGHSTTPTPPSASRRRAARVRRAQPTRAGWPERRAHRSRSARRRPTARPTSRWRPTARHPRPGAP